MNRLIISIVVIVFSIQTIPAIKNFHVESALLVGVILFLFGASKGYSWAKKGIVIWVVSGISLLVIDYSRGCFSVEGLSLWLLHPPLSLFLGVSIHGFADAANPKKSGRIGLSIAVGFMLIELGLTTLFLPHVYIFGHSFGFWPGPVYDRAVLVDGLHLVFRGLTISLALFLIQVKNQILFGKSQRIVALIRVVIFLVICFAAGVYRSQSSIQSDLGGATYYKDISLYYNPDQTSSTYADSIATRAQEYVEELNSSLELSAPTKTINIYLYDHAWQKKKFTGAKYTSYVPVWQSSDQVHITKQAITPTLKHELVHVVAKRFGNWFGASYNAMLIEGIAVALAPSGKDNDKLVKAGELQNKIDLQKLFSVTGFYLSRGSQSYSVAGSFVDYVIQNEGPSLVKIWYRDGTLPDGQDQLESQIQQWKNHINSLEVDSSMIKRSERVYSRRSPVELDCPHVFTKLEKDVDSAVRFLQEGDTARAIVLIDGYQSDSVLYGRLQEALLKD